MCMSVCVWCVCSTWEVIRRYIFAIKIGQISEVFHCTLVTCSSTGGHSGCSGVRTEILSIIKLLVAVVQHVLDSETWSFKIILQHSGLVCVAIVEYSTKTAAVKVHIYQHTVIQRWLVGNKKRSNTDWLTFEEIQTSSAAKFPTTPIHVAIGLTTNITWIIMHIINTDGVPNDHFWMYICSWLLDVNYHYKLSSSFGR